MYKRTLLAVLTGAALLTACDKNKEEKIIPVSFSSFGFYAQNNAEALKSDYIEENVTSDVISFTLPYGTDPEAVKTLVPTFAVTEGASVNKADASGAPDGEEIVSGETAVDFSSDVQLVVFLKNNYKAYTVSVKIAEPAKWGKVAESSLVMKSDPVLTVNPVDGVPYVAGSSANADGVAEPHLLKLDGAELKDVAGALAAVDSKYFALDFNPSGTPYVSFYDGSLKKQSVVKIDGATASYVGDAGSMFQTGGSSNSSVAVFPVSGNDVWCAQYNNLKNDLAGKRALNLAHFDGSSWTNGISLNDRTASDFAYCVLGKQLNGVPYLFIYNQNSQSISLYRYAESAWSTVFESLKIKQADGTTDATLNLRAFDFDIASDGSVYVMAGADYSTAKVYNIAIVRISAKDASQQIVGGETSINIDDYRSASFGLDANDVPYIVYTKPEGGEKYAYITRIDSKTKNWAEEEKLSSAPSGFVVLRFAENGKGYVASIEDSADGKKYVLYSSAE